MKLKIETSCIFKIFIDTSFICFMKEAINCFFKSRQQRCSLKEGVLRNLAKFTGKHLCQSLFFKKFAGLRPTTLLKKRLWHSCFPVNFAKFLRIPFLREHLRTTASTSLVEHPLNSPDEQTEHETPLLS